MISFLLFPALLTLGQRILVEPFGVASDFDVSEDYIIYCTKDPELPEAILSRMLGRCISRPKAGLPTESRGYTS